MSTIAARNHRVAAANPVQVAKAHQRAAYATDALHPAVYGLAIASYVGFLAVMWLMFVNDATTFVSLSICTAYLVMFFGVPLVMVRTANKATGAATTTNEGTLGRFLRGDLETITGPLSGYAALAQVLVIPVGLTFGIVAMGIIFHTV